MEHHHKLDCLVKRLDYSVVVVVIVTGISSTVEPFITKLGMVVHRHGPECYARRLVCCLGAQGHSESSYNQI